MSFTKKLCLAPSLVAALVLQARAQGNIIYANFLNSSTDPTASADGLVWTSAGGAPALINEDFNIAFYIGTTSQNLSLIDTALISNGTAVGDCREPGIFVIPGGYTVPGARNSAFVRIQAWTGLYDSYEAAFAGGGLTAQTPVFSNPLSIDGGGPPVGLKGMPAMVLSVVPEPSPVALVLLGALCILNPLIRKSR
jgi:hypothetical protein